MKDVSCTDPGRALYARELPGVATQKLFKTPVMASFVILKS